jgi:hypothetical protein
MTPDGFKKGIEIFGQSQEQVENIIQSARENPDH